MPKIHGTNLAAHRRSTRDALFSAFTHLLVTNGYADISLSELTKIAGVGRTVFYNYFGSKEELLLALIRLETQKFTDVLDKILASTNDPVRKLEIFIYSQLVIRGKSFFVSPGLSSQLSPAGNAELAKHGKRVRQHLTDILDALATAKMLNPTHLPALQELVLATLYGVNPPTEPTAQKQFLIDTQRFILQALRLPIPISTQGAGTNMQLVRLADGSVRRLPAAAVFVTSCPDLDELYPSDSPKPADLKTEPDSTLRCPYAH